MTAQAVWIHCDECWSVLKQIDVGDLGDGTIDIPTCSRHSLDPPRSSYVVESRRLKSEVELCTKQIAHVGINWGVS